MKKIFFIVVGNHTFSRILLPKSYTFSRITPCTLYWIQKVRPQKSIIHPSNIQQKSLSLLTTKSAIRTSYKGSKPGTLDTSKAQIQRRNRVKGHTDTRLEPSVCKALILNSRLKLHRKVVVLHRQIAVLCQYINTQSFLYCT